MSEEPLAIPLADVLRAANDLVAAGLIEDYALGGALAAIYYVAGRPRKSSACWGLQRENRFSEVERRASREGCRIPDSGARTESSGMPEWSRALREQAEIPVSVILPINSASGDAGAD